MPRFANFTLDTAAVAEPTKPSTPEDDFRSALKDVIAIVKKLAPYCTSVDDLIGMAELGLENSGQLALLMDQVTPVQAKMKR